MVKRARTDSLSSLSPSSDHSDPEHVEAADHTAKYASLHVNERPTTIMQCQLPPHAPLSFATHDEYETHYVQSHTNRCTECGKNFPSAHFLDLHIAENHDPIAAFKRDAGEKTYACFVEGCDKICREWKKRRSHLVDKHGFPRNYDFLVIDHGIDRRMSMLRPGIDENGHRASSRDRGRSNEAVSGTVRPTEPVHTKGPVTNDAGTTNNSLVHDSKDASKTSMDELTNSLSSLNMVPRSVMFGRRKGRAGLAKS